MTTSLPGPDGQLRCRWCHATPEYLAYHDEEWGYPVVDDRRLFEKLSLEAFQSGLSWRTILAKRANFRRAFAGFEIAQVARFGAAERAALRADAGIVRHAGKIDAVINNAQRALALIAEQGSLARHVWSYESPAEPLDAAPRSTSPAAVALAKDLKKRGWQFVGPTTVYAFMQAMGLVNDHAPDCVTRARVAQARQRFSRP